MDERESGTNAAIDLLGVMDPHGKIDTCEEWVRWAFRGLVFDLALAGFGKARVICGRRTFGEQVQLYGKGRTGDELAVIGLSSGYAKPKERRVTWLMPHASRHVQGAAIDFDFKDYTEVELEPVREICRQLKITWGGVWSVRDYAHVEL